MKNSTYINNIINYLKNKRHEKFIPFHDFCNRIIYK
jgi:hypothetical protein